MQDAIYLALDVPDARAAEPIVQALASEVGGFKVGSELFLAEGPAICARLTALGARVFVDLKLHDIPRTVEAGAKRLAELGASIITVHALGGADMIQAAVEGAAFNPKTRVVAVTVLTSHTEKTLAEVGVMGDVPAAVERLAGMALAAGAHGLVCSVHETKRLRALHGAAPLIVCPGIRLPGGAAHDQARVSTPEDAIRAGASVLVLGRAVLEASDRRAALALVEKSMALGRV